MNNDKQQATGTVYIAPGGLFCNVYAMPYPMRQGQRPADLAHRYQLQWKLVGRLDSNLKVVFLDPALQDFKADIEGAMGGTWMAVPAECLEHIFPRPAADEMVPEFRP